MHYGYVLNCKFEFIGYNSDNRYSKEIKNICRILIKHSRYELISGTKKEFTLFFWYKEIQKMDNSNGLYKIELAQFSSYETIHFKNLLGEKYTSNDVYTFFVPNALIIVVMFIFNYFTF